MSSFGLGHSVKIHSINEICFWMMSVTCIMKCKKVSQMPVCQMTIQEVSVGQKSVGQMSVGQMSVGQMYFG